MIKNYRSAIKFVYAIAFLLFLVLASNAQDTASKKAILESRVFVDAYYSYDFSNPASHEKAAFLYNHNRHNEVNVNLALASISYKSQRTRAAIGLMMGTYAQYNLAAEPQLLQHVYEANAGIKVSTENELWIDAGILPSHIGFESAISKDCWTLTRSILAENSPYYEAGLRLSYITKKEHWYFAALLLNGWQRISRIQGNNTPAFGTQVTYSPTNRFSINWSTFIGNAKPDSTRQWRCFNNLYAVCQMSKHWGFTLGIDYGIEQKHYRSSNYYKWYSPVAIVRYENSKWSVAARAEYYNDKSGIIVTLVNAEPFQMQGYSLNFDKKINENALWRIEWRMFSNKYPYFEQSNGFSSYSQFVTTSVMINIGN